MAEPTITELLRKHTTADPGITKRGSHRKWMQKSLLPQAADELDQRAETIRNLEEDVQRYQTAAKFMGVEEQYDAVTTLLDPTTFEGVDYDTLTTAIEVLDVPADTNIRIANHFFEGVGAEAKIEPTILDRAQALYETAMEDGETTSLKLGAIMGLQAVRAARVKGESQSVVAEGIAPIPENQMDIIARQDPTLTIGQYSVKVLRRATRHAEFEGTAAGQFVRAAYELTRVIEPAQDGRPSLRPDYQTRLQERITSALTRDSTLLSQAIELAEHYAEQGHYDVVEAVREGIVQGATEGEESAYAVAIGKAARGCELVSVKVALYEASLQVEESAIRWENLGLLHKREGETEKAFAAYSNALRVNPNAKFAPREVERLGEEIDPQALGQLPELYTQSLEVEAEIIQS